MFHLKFIGIMLKAIVLLVLFVGAVVAVLVSMWRKVWHRQHLENELSSLMAPEVMVSDSDELSVFHSARDFSFHSLVLSFCPFLLVFNGKICIVSLPN